MPFIDLNITDGAAAGDATVTFTAVCPTSVSLGDVVYVSGDKTGGMYQVDKVDITSFLKMPAAGVVIQKLTSTTAVIMCNGEVTGIYGSLTPGKTYFADSNARLSSTAPGSPSTGVQFVQAIAYSLASDTLFIRVHKPLVRVSN